MKAPEPNDDLRDESRDPAWALLKRSRPSQPGPAFVQNTVRCVRQLQGEEKGGNRGFAAWWQALMRPVFQVPLATAALVAIVAIVASRSPDSGDSPGVASTGNSPASAAVESPAVEAEMVDYTFADQLQQIDYLDGLVAVNDPASLDEQMLADLLY